jgi:N-formylglutamate amidohydrolase
MVYKNWTIAAALFWAIPCGGSEPEPLVLAKAGNIPIILSAPHGGRTAIPDVEPRKNGGATDFNTVRDENTAELATLIASAIEKRLHGKPYLVIAQFERRFVDVNRTEEMGVESEKARPYYRAYHRILKDDCNEVAGKWKHGLLLDIHGQAKHPNSLVRGTNNGQTVESLVKRFGPQALNGPRSIFGSFEAMGNSIVPASQSNDAEDKRFIGGYTVRTYGSHQGGKIDAIQLEFGSEFREKKNLAKTASAISEAIEIFCTAYLPEAVIKDNANGPSRP